MPTRKTITKPRTKPRTSTAPAAAPAAAPRKAAPKARRPAAKAVVAAPAKPPKEAKPAKPPKLALVRDSFTMPEPDFALVAQLKARALSAKRTAKKSELLRAGLHALAALDGKALVAALDRLAPVKTGRPKKGH